jgi:hypothetical protein
MMKLVKKFALTFITVMEDKNTCTIHASAVAILENQTTSQTTRIGMMFNVRVHARLHQHLVFIMSKLGVKISADALVQMNQPPLALKELSSVLNVDVSVFLLVMNYHHQPVAKSPCIGAKKPVNASVLKKISHTVTSVHILKKFGTTLHALAIAIIYKLVMEISTSKVMFARANVLSLSQKVDVQVLILSLDGLNNSVTADVPTSSLKDQLASIPMDQNDGLTANVLASAKLHQFVMPPNLIQT